MIKMMKIKKIKRTKSIVYKLKVEVKIKIKQINK